MDIVAFIPVRGGSKSIPLKNIKPLSGKPLVHWTMSAALACPRIDRVYVASESAEIRRVAEAIESEKLHVIGRSAETATDTASTESALLEFATEHAFDAVVLIQATSPLLLAADLTEAIALYERSGADAVLSVVREHRFIWRPDADGTVTPHNYTPSARPRRQSWDGELIENGAFYITGREALLESNCRLSGKIVAYEMAPETAVELDAPHDFILMEHLLAAKQKTPLPLAEQCRRIKLLVTDMDGTLTDAGVYVGAEGELCKKFSTRDGMGFALWRRAGLTAAIMTSEDSPIITRRANKLKVNHIYKGIMDKAAALTSLVESLGLTPDEVLFIGDDVNDLPAFEVAGLTACPADATTEIKARAHYICAAEGGRGAVREVIDLVLAHRG